MSRPSHDKNGSFHDLERLIAELDKPPIIELGKPEPQEKFLPKDVVRCPAQHNRVLLDADDDG